MAQWPLHYQQKQDKTWIIEQGNNKEITWKSYDADGSIWFEDTLLFSDISKETTTENESVKTTLTTILHEAFKLNPHFILNSVGYKITTELGFPKSLGFGHIIDLNQQYCTMVAN